MLELRGETLCRSRDGFIVIATLWILSALATLALIFSIYIASAVTSISVRDDVISAEALILASLELTAYHVTVRREDRPSSGRFSFRMNGANVWVDFCSEAARINLNKASKELLVGLFGTLGANGDDAEQYADRVIGWRSGRSFASEEALYQAAGLNYRPRGAPFAHIGELALVFGLPPAMVERAMPFVTIFGERSQVNIRDAAPEVIAALPGMTPERLNAVLKDRFSPSLAQLGAAQTEVTTEGSKAIRVTVRMIFGSGRKMTSEAVILIDSGSEPYRVLSWQDDTDPEARGRRS